MSSTVTWALSSSLRLADYLGGTGGNPYNDIATVLTTSTLPKITSLTIRSGDRVDALSYTAQYAN
ncbi:hypothetical protein H0H93_006977, partial [Arthromyces matolae]